MGRLAEQQITSESVKLVSSSSSTQLANEFKAILSASFGSVAKFKQSIDVRKTVHTVVRTAETGSKFCPLSVPSKAKLHSYCLSNSDNQGKTYLLRKLSQHIKVSIDDCVPKDSVTIFEV